MKVDTIKNLTSAQLYEYLVNEQADDELELNTDTNSLHKIAQQYLANQQYIQAFAAFELGYRLGSLDHCFEQAQLLKHGYVAYEQHDATYNALQALEQFKQLAYNDHLKSMLEVARAYDHKDKETSYPGILDTKPESPELWYDRIIKLTDNDINYSEINALAKFRLACIEYAQGELYKDNFDMNSVHIRDRLYNQAQHYFTELANNNNYEAALQAGIMLYNRQGRLIADPNNKNSVDFTKNNQLAGDYFNRALKSHDPYTESTAYVHIGMLYQYGYSPYNSDPRQAEQHYLKASSGTGLLKIGEMYELGWEGQNSTIRQDLVKAYQHYEAAYQAGLPFGLPMVFSLCEDVKYHHQSGDYTSYSQLRLHRSKNERSAWRHNQLESTALTTETLQAQMEKANELLHCDNQESVRQGVNLMKYCADNGFISAQYYLGFYLLQQQNSNSQQYGLEMLHQAAYTGHPSAQAALGQYYYQQHLKDHSVNSQDEQFKTASGQERLKNRDLGKAVTYMKKAAQSSRVTLLKTPATQKSNNSTKASKFEPGKRSNKVTTLSDCSNDNVKKPNSDASSSNLFFSGQGRQLGGNSHQQDQDEDSACSYDNQAPGNH